MTSLPTRGRRKKEACDVEGKVKLTLRAYPHLVENEKAHLKAAAKLDLAVVRRS